MISDWFSRVGSAIPRGFSRHYILELLSEQPMTGKEIIDKAIIQTGGKWKPSPGLIYPLLGRLLEGGFIEEHDNGRYRITNHNAITHTIFITICPPSPRIAAQSETKGCGPP